MPEISVIIPTYNRLETLKKCLLALKNNKFNQPFEVIIIDDGSNDNTFSEIKQFLQQNNLSNFEIYNQKNGGPSKARNHGINLAKAEIILIIGDDSIADPQLLAEHHNWNKFKYSQKNIAILGHDEWDPEIEITPFMRWIDDTGMQFSYHRFDNEHSPTWGDLWTCNISLKKSFLQKYGLFDEDFPYAAWEDVELGWRLSKFNFAIKYHKGAKVVHHHPTVFNNVKQRMFYHGFSQKILAGKLGDEYYNKLWQEPYKSSLRILDKILTYSGLLFLLDKTANWLQYKKVINSIFYPVLYHYKLKGFEHYDKTKNINT